jgi:Ca2+-transporting ATPase
MALHRQDASPWRLVAQGLQLFSIPVANRKLWLQEPWRSRRGRGGSVRDLHNATPGRGMRHRQAYGVGMTQQPADVGGESGLSSAEAARRLASVGPNELQREAGPSALGLLASQFVNPMVALLLVASGVAGALGELADAVAIGTIVVLNAVVGFVQEYRAEKALLALRAMTAPRARVLRDGRSAMIAASEVVPGDLLVLEAGDVVSADAKLREAHQLSTIEAALTGESLPVAKSPEEGATPAPLAERHDHVFLGTSVATGTGRATVTATGMRTEMGRIASLLASAESGETPLQKRLDQVSRTLLLLCLAVVGIVGLLGVLHGDPLLEVLLTSVSLAVAAVPEGLPAVVTIALAVGVQRMAARHVLVRRLPAVETLGSTTVICTDKTGTLTTGVMAVREVWGQDHDAVLRAAVACVDAELGPSGQGIGDPTEVALLVAAAQRGMLREQIEQHNPRRKVEPFDSETKRMAVLRADGVLYVKGAAERLLPLSRSGTEGALAAMERMAERGLRVLGVAVGRGEEVRDLGFLGLVGMADPPRPEAIAAIAAAKKGGIRTVMITGDHPVTARAIARELGILGATDDPDQVVHARATPEDKIKIVRDWKARGAIVAMTGDGVNDAPAIREAHIGIAMGKGGTEVTREAASVVLTDDNFASIVEGVREGRTIYENIRKTLVYLLSGNAGELMVMFAASLMGLPLPLLPLHLLWINLLTDGLPALALVMDPPDADVMSRPPRDPNEPMLGRSQWVTIAITGALQAAVTLGVFVSALDEGEAVARNLAFSTLVFGELFRAFAARSPDRVLFEVGLFTNLKLLGIVTLSAVFQLALHHVPWIEEVFQIAPLTLEQCLTSIGLGLIPVSVLELGKLVRRALRPRSEP